MAVSDTEPAIALTRLGLGARPGELDRVGRDPRGWALAQIRSHGAPQPSGDLVDSNQRMSDFLTYQAIGAEAVRNRPAAPAGPAAVDAGPQAIRQARQAARKAISEDTDKEFLARARLGATTDHGFAERWALFWSNAITVSATKFTAAAFAGQYEREAIRPHVFGKFEDLALAAEQHPAMLFYLDQARSIGPDSRAGARRRGAGLNENLAREMMELHTVGAEAGYAQADVTELARALTGWSVPTHRDEGVGDRQGGRRQGANAAERTPHAFVYRPEYHEPGERRVMGKTYPAGDLEQGQAILRDLARHPATARRLSHRIAAHFIADDPPPALVARLEQTWTTTGGDLAEVARALVEAGETWSPQPLKMKTPYEFIISAHRATGTEPDRLSPLRAALADMGQPMFAAPSPEGWPDSTADWIGPDALVKRLNWAKRFGGLAGAENPGAVAAQALGPRLGDRTRLAVARAESRPEAMTLFLMSPEFQRR